MVTAVYIPSTRESINIILINQIAENIKPLPFNKPENFPVKAKTLS